MSFPSMSTEENKCLKTELETNFDEMDLNMLLKQIVKMNLQFYNNYLRFEAIPQFHDEAGWTSFNNYQLKIESLALVDL